MFGTKLIVIHMTERCILRNLMKANEHICKFLHSVISSLLPLRLQKWLWLSETKLKKWQRDSRLCSHFYSLTYPVFSSQSLTSCELKQSLLYAKFHIRYFIGFIPPNFMCWNPNLISSGYVFIWGVLSSAKLSSC